MLPPCLKKKNSFSKNPKQTLKNEKSDFFKGKKSETYF